ncbi:RNA-binding S4 domain-containing protein [Corynebacterium sp. 320]|uniref:RNA-binding S4 domain-containing protein n=1 Tax=Corynebacterium zhongnanshanii TaxID=2768834 RepID=A0ABQ6VEU4_9CORY|nr:MULTISPECIES: RNA-binding S4 domain-containing protein [Corynebacterium]KAB1502522.1 RNA-binding S4 domain-containing protein [Corynebacterium sp. 320]KAB1551257.1 RNA-binding S4 domain-containing protein [Corynebacterium sp. 321]KAB1551915.1 RNA-binding S4 domain-containing protein [Corynebacterium sp. 319]KAB3520796.1 RNA-binding S4 domain-containing protein [Corynebacterium zhongnanshanii]KAB3526129.1 RNA-binding S4 domain-containing protein [Corynebacterium sp. 250]
MSTRIDAWVWSVRIFKTRTAAAEACRAGHVKINDVTVKPSQSVVVGDRVRVWAHHREYVLEVTQLLSKRVGAPLARAAYIDHSPPPPLIPAMPRRDRGAGRPTKRERRQLEKFIR